MQNIVAKVHLGDELLTVHKGSQLAASGTVAEAGFLVGARGAASESDACT